MLFDPSYFAASDFAGPFRRLRRGWRPRRTAARTRRASSIFTCSRCPGRPRSARQPPSAAIAGAHRSSARRPYSFVVHGLWPQYERGFPEYCQRPSPRLDRNIMSSMLDLMPAPGLIFNEWDKHGTCSGLGARAYFESIRKARAAVKIPENS